MTTTRSMTAPKSERPTPADPQAVQRWRELRLGMFIHWGPVTLRGTEIGWSRGQEVPVEDYDSLYREFNPVLFNADEWVAIAKAAGLRYVVLTTKHHDGFCLWPTKQTDYHIGHTPFGRDVVGELATACRQQGLAFGAYYSIADWRHPDYPLGGWGGRTPQPAANLDRYTAYLWAQVRELQQAYGPLLCFWFDGQSNPPWTPEHGVALHNWLHELQPGLLVNNRVGTGAVGTFNLPFNPAERPGDFGTPEQEVGAFNRDLPWESCLTICQQWAWKPNDRLKSLKECLDILIHTIGGDGNLLLNVGPMPDGRIEARQVRRLNELGAFVQRHADAIYGTRGGPFPPGAWGASTCRNNKIYLFVSDRPKQRPLQLPAIGPRLLAAQTSDGRPIAINQGGAGVTLTLPEPLRDKSIMVIELTLEGRACDITPILV